MATDTPPPAQRPRTSLLVLLGVAVVALIAYWMWQSASSAAAPSNQQRTQRAQAAQGQGAPPLNVRLDELKGPPPEPSESERNPFRFQPKPPPPPPPPPAMGGRGTGRGEPGSEPGGAPLPPQVPPIPLKFIGTLEGRGPGKVAIFSDNRGLPVYGREGDIILGQYRIVKIGVESVVMEYVDGRGRQTIPLRG